MIADPAPASRVNRWYAPGPMTTSRLPALAAFGWLCIAVPAVAADVPPPPEEGSSAQDAAADAAPEAAPQRGWGPIIAACLGVLAGGWIARKQIQGWKAKG
jgi:hypothetical protein